MNKSLFYFIFLSGFCLSMRAQHDGFRLSAHAGLPLSDAADFSSFNAGAEAAYLFRVAQNVAIGVSTGYSAFSGKDDFDSYSFVPVAVSGRTGYGENLFYGADVGYAAALHKDNGGIYYQAKLGWTNSRIDAFAFYKGVSAQGVSISAVGLGFGFKI